MAAAWFGIMMALWLPEAVLRRLVESASSELAAMIRLEFPLDHRVLLWALAMTVTACVGFGLVPALRSTEVGLSDLLKESHGISKRALMPSLLSYQTIVSVMALAIVGFGAAARVLGSIGFFSLLDYAVQYRTREIGIRRALGAHTWDVVRALVEPATRPLIRGVLIGTAGAIGAGAFMRRADLPAGVNPLDALTYVSVAAALIIAAVLASYAPARRALQIAPAEALRVD